MIKINNIKIISILLLCTIVGLWYFTRPKQAAPNNTNNLIIGTNADYPPFTFVKDDTIVGFDIDIAKEVARRLDKKPIIKDMPFDALIIEAQQGSIDVIAAGMTATAEREKKLFFTTPYISGDPLIIVTLKKNNKINSVQELKGKEVIVNEGFVADMYMSKQENIPLIRLATVAEGFLALRSGRGYAFVTAANAAQQFIKKYGAHEFHVTPIEGTSDTYSLAVSHKKEELFKKIQDTITAMIADGTIAQLKTKWELA